MMVYNRLWKLLADRGMKKTDLKEILSPNTIAKMGKGETINCSVIDKICCFLDCQPGDIMEYLGENCEYSNNKSINECLVFLLSDAEMSVDGSLFDSYYRKRLENLIVIKDYIQTLEKRLNK